MGQETTQPVSPEPGATTSSTSRPHLLGIPGEIRNRIYRLVPVDDRRRAVIIGRGLNEAALLSVCKMIRKEGGPIFYAENRIWIVNQCYDSEPFCFFMAKGRLLMKEFGPELVPFATVSFTGSLAPNWDNLLKWMRHYHGGRTRIGKARFPPEYESENQDLRLELDVICTLFSTVDALLDRPWWVVERLVQKHRKILIGLNIDWKTDWKSDSEG